MQKLWWHHHCCLITRNLQRQC